MNLRNNEEFNFLERVLYLYCCDKFTAKQVQRYVKGLGWKINLRMRRHSCFEAFDRDGNFYWLQP